jgi:hypothetical protein
VIKHREKVGPSALANSITSDFIVLSCFIRIYGMAGLNGLNLGAITENATRLGQRLQETLSERTRDLSLAASGSSYLETTDDKLKNIRQQLDSSSDREKLEAMKRLIAVRLSVRGVRMLLTVSILSS